jgi:hypothetical protein
MAPRERASWRSNGFDPSGLIHLSFRQAFTRSELYWFWTRTGHWRRMTTGVRAIKARGRARYLVIILLGAVLGVCSAGEITNVTQAFQPSGRF